jgi:hypothetical protein
MGSTSGDSVTKSVVLHTERHAHLIRFLDRVQAEDPRGVSKVIRAALELYIERRETEGRQGVVTIEEIEAACRRAIEGALQGRVVEVDADSGLVVESAETQTKNQLTKMRQALDQWGEE